jgi:succinate dehydrogenase / fumarate reductase membrane anchor subunit
MSYLTNYKRAAGLGSAKAGTEHHWGMTVSSVALLILIPLFVITFAPQVGNTYEQVTAYYAHPLPAIIAALTIWFSFMHFKNGVVVLLEDYVPGHGARAALIIAMTCLSYAAAATGVFAIARLAL